MEKQYKYTMIMYQTYSEDNIEINKLDYDSVNAIIKATYYSEDLRISIIDTGTKKVYTKNEFLELIKENCNEYK